jgi:predicted nucleic acid-binding protein
MNGNLVDTNVIIKMLNGDPEAIRIFDSLDNIHISVITAGELFYGANKSSQTAENMKLLRTSFVNIQ